MSVKQANLLGTTVKCSFKDRCSYILVALLGEQTYQDKSVHCESHPMPKTTVTKSYHLFMSYLSQDTQALLGKVTGSVTLNKPAVLSRLREQATGQLILISEHCRDVLCP